MTENEKLDLILSELQGMKTEMQDMKADIQGMKDDIQGMKADIVEIKQRVTKTELIIENELRRNIMRVAEGHLDLSRKLNQCIYLSSEVKDKLEIQELVTNMHTAKLNLP